MSNATPAGNPPDRATAAILVIGSELLSGKCPETNSNHLIRLLGQTGIRLRRLVLLPDELEPVAAELRQAIPGHSLVFTIGGLGPTHDDRTVEAVALALGTPRVIHPELQELFEQRCGKELTQAHRKLLLVPEGCRLHRGGVSFYPLLQCRNVYLLPGVPHQFEDKLRVLHDLLAGQPLARITVVIERPELTFADRLATVAARFPGVEIGSYPIRERTPAVAGHPRSWVEVTFEAEEGAQAEAAQAAVVEELARAGIPVGQADRGETTPSCPAPAPGLPSGTRGR